jgi:hypothetical protein
MVRICLGGGGGWEYYWRYSEAQVELQFSGAGVVPAVWRIALDVPAKRRLKYAFRIKTAAADYYFSENGLEPYRTEAVAKTFNHFFLSVYSRS